VSVLPVLVRPSSSDLANEMDRKGKQRALPYALALTQPVRNHSRDLSFPQSSLFPFFDPHSRLTITRTLETPS
jgi:hypothetical protein